MIWKLKRREEDQLRRKVLSSIRPLLLSLLQMILEQKKRSLSTLLRKRKEKTEDIEKSRIRRGWHDVSFRHEFWEILNPNMENILRNFSKYKGIFSSQLQNRFLLLVKLTYSTLVVSTISTETRIKFVRWADAST